MKVSNPADAAAATAQTSKDRPEVAATLLQRMNHALNANAPSTPAQTQARPEARQLDSSAADRPMQRRQEDEQSTARGATPGWSTSRDENDWRSVPHDPRTDNNNRLLGEPAFGTVAGRAPTSDAPANALPGQRTTQASFADELLTLLDRVSAGVYVGDRSNPQQRVLLTLEGALPGAAAELVRDGAHLTIRLHASNETAYRTMLAQRDALSRTLQEHDLPHVTVELLPVGGVLDARRE